MRRYLFILVTVVMANNALATVDSVVKMNETVNGKTLGEYASFLVAVGSINAK